MRESAGSIAGPCQWQAYWHIFKDKTRGLDTSSSLELAPPGIDEGCLYGTAKILNIKGYHSCARELRAAADIRGFARNRLQ